MRLDTEIKEVLEKKFIDERINVRGWVKSIQQHGNNLTFIQINDGSTSKNLQVIYRLSLEENISVGSAIEVSGIMQNSINKKQEVEMVSDYLNLLALADEKFPIQKKEHSLEFLREVCFQRHRTKLFLIVNKIKSDLAFYIHEFFNNHGFYWVQTPILTSNNCEGGSDVFCIEGSDKFFKKEALLTVSGQFHAEAMSLGLKKVYTFGPTFRAEKSNTSQHLAEFWMIEPEVAFATLEDNINLIESFIKYVVRKTYENHKEDLAYLAEKIEGNDNLLSKLENLINTDFEKITYKKVISILEEDQQQGKVVFENKDIHFGMDLNCEHEKYITKIFQKPVFVTHYPRLLKAFYMKDEDSETVKAVDLLIPEVGELIGGSERESREEKLREKAQELKIPLDALEWYLQLRRYGYYASSGFGCGFERLIMYVTGIKNIKDVINFPRSYGHLNF